MTSAKCLLLAYRVCLTTALFHLVESVLRLSLSVLADNSGIEVKVCVSLRWCLYSGPPFIVIPVQSRLALGPSASWQPGCALRFCYCCLSLAPHYKPELSRVWRDGGGILGLSVHTSPLFAVVCRHQRPGEVEMLRGFVISSQCSQSQGVSAWPPIGAQCFRMANDPPQPRWLPGLPGLCASVPVCLCASAWLCGGLHADS